MSQFEPIISIFEPIYSELPLFFPILYLYFLSFIEICDPKAKMRPFFTNERILLLIMFHFQNKSNHGFAFTFRRKTDFIFQTSDIFFIYKLTFQSFI